MSWNHPINEKIREAMSNGDLDLPENLAGKPLDLADYFATPEDLRVGYSVLKNANCTPLEVDLLNQKNQLENAIENESDPLRISEFQQLLAAVRARLDLKN